MKLTDIAPLADDELTLLLMGPGFGESLLVCWPPGEWFVVDSFRRTKKGVEHHPMIDVLSHFDARLSAVALTHPHQDHTGGFASLVSRRRPGARVGWLAAPEKDVWWATPNAQSAHRQGATEHAIAAVETVWEDDPASRWELHAGAPPLALHDATIEVLSPPATVVETVTAAARPDLNRISSAMLLTWGDCRLLLGADLTNPGWQALELELGPLHFADTSAIKVAHHGSEEAQHPVALGAPPARDRLSIVSPYTRGKKVPDFQNGQDIDLLLQVTTRVYLTTHHGPLPAGAGIADTPRANISNPQRRIGRHAISLSVPAPPLEDCWVAAQFGRDGALRRVHRGVASMSVVAP
jgi:hypothetical protein